MMMMMMRALSLLLHLCPNDDDSDNVVCQQNSLEYNREQEYTPSTPNMRVSWTAGMSFALPVIDMALILKLRHPFRQTAPGIQ